MLWNGEHKPSPQSRQRVRDLARAGVPQNGIADILEISDDTLRKYYRKELDQSLDELIECIANKAIQLAEEGNEKMISLVLKTKGASRGWVEKQVVENVDSSETKELQARVQALEQEHQRDY